LNLTIKLAFEEVGQFLFNTIYLFNLEKRDPMNILLIQPPVQDFYQTSIRTQPIGLAYLAASLRTHGHEVEILDCQTEKKRSIPIPCCDKGDVRAERA
jgi:hypothetical protein